MKTFKNLLWVVLCLVLCMGLAVPAMAANENNNRGVTFSAALDRASIEESAAEQLVTMTLSASKPVTMDGLGFTVTWTFDKSEGILTISGDGVISAYDRGEVPWWNYRRQIKCIFGCILVRGAERRVPGCYG